MKSMQALQPLRPFNRPRHLLGTNRIWRSLSSSSQSDLRGQKEAQLDREKMNTETNEGTKTGTDASSASQKEAAYNPNITQPQEEKEEAGKENEHNPLDASGANPELGKPTAEDASGAGTKTRSGSRK